jgi:hypothetical protein
MPTPRIKRYQKHVTIKLKSEQEKAIDILRTPPGISFIAHPLKNQNKGYANVGLLASDVQVYDENKDVKEKIDETLARMNVINDNVTGKDEKNVRIMKSSHNKHGPSREYFLDSPELDGQNDYLRSRLIDIHKTILPKQEVRRINKIYESMGYKRGLNENKRIHYQGELYSDNPV